VQKSKIEWTEATWNPVRGCSRVSEGCRNCYAERVAGRFCGELSGSGRGTKFVSGPFTGFATKRGWTGKVELIEEKLDEPLHWKKPRTIFVNSMSDLFHEKLPDEAIWRVADVMRQARQHRYLVLTKRSKRMRELWPKIRGTMPDRLEHVAMGVSAEDQPRAYERINDLRLTPAAMRFVSIEPMLEAVNVVAWLPFLDWVIVGGESGPGARPCSVLAIRDIIRQCKAAGVAVFVKQLGSQISGLFCGATKEEQGGCEWNARGSKGQDITDWPLDLRVRELPKFLE
jgi:protein gp37